MPELEVSTLCLWLAYLVLSASFISGTVLVAGYSVVSKARGSCPTCSISEAEAGCKPGKNLMQTARVVGISIRRANRCFEGEQMVREGLYRAKFEVKA